MQAPLALLSFPRSGFSFLSLVWGTWLCLALGCKTTDSGGQPSQLIDNPIYDGSAESMDSLPDCGAETLGTLFWVREANTGFECTADGKWTIRSYRDPDGTMHSPAAGS